MFKPATPFPLVHPYLDINRLYFGNDKYLEGCWPFNRGLATDTSGKGRNGTIGGSIVAGPGAFGSGIYIPNGQSNAHYVNLGFSDFSGRSYTTEFTILAWCRPVASIPAGDAAQVFSNTGFYAASPTDFPVFLAYGADATNTGGSYSVGISKGDDYTGDASVTIYNKTGSVSPRWSFVAATYKTSEHLALFCNGEYSKTSINFAIAASGTPRNFFVGRAAFTQTAYSTFPGGISDVAMLSRALSEAEIRTYYEWATSLKKPVTRYFSTAVPTPERQRVARLRIDSKVRNLVGPKGGFGTAALDAFLPLGGVVPDLSGKARTLTYTGTSSTLGPYNLGPATLFAGNSGSYVQSSLTIPLGTNYTIAFWIRRDSNTGASANYAHALIGTPGGATNWNLYYYDDRHGTRPDVLLINPYYSGSSNGMYSYPIRLYLNTWRHIVITGTVNVANQGCFYVDGVKRGVETDIIVTTAAWPGVTSVINMGYLSCADTSGLNGVLKDVIFLDRKVSEQEVKSYYELVSGVTYG